MNDRPAATASGPWAASAILSDIAAVIAGSGISALLLMYLHGDWHPGWAAISGLLAGFFLRRMVRPTYKTFPNYLRRPIDIGVLLLGTVVTSWATLVTEPSAVWLLRWRESVTLFVIAIALGLGLAGVIYSHSRMRREIEEARAREAALTEATLRARLRALQAQINPHFLFNAFNALAELTHDDPRVAEELVGDLAHLLRYTLRSSALRRVPLAQELEAVHRYLRVEKARLGDRLQVDEDIEPDALQFPVPGLVLQPLVENAVQHAVAAIADGGAVRIHAARAEAGLLVTVEDDGPGVPAELARQLAAIGNGDRVDAGAIGLGTGGAGGGLTNVAQRLSLSYRGAATLTVTDLSPGTRIEMRIPS